MSSGPKAPVPVTVLCGFLGAGKTTMLNHLLKQAEGRRWAAVVNDLASVNLDAALIQTEGNTEVVALSNGCVCCSSRDELGETVCRLAASGAYEHLLVETTGVALPRGIASLFLRPNPFGRSVGDFAVLANLVSVVDAAHFLREWKTVRAGGRERELMPSLERPVLELMIEQVEAADVVVVNKADLVSEEELAELRAVIEGLNPGVEQVVTERAQIASELFVGRSRFEVTRTLASARWIRALNALAPAPTGGLVARPAIRGEHDERFGIRSVVYQARRPLVRERFEAWLRREAPGLLRAKGYFWLAEQPDEMGFLSVAGTGVQTDFVAWWWASQVESGKVRRNQVPPPVEALWKEPHGDRRQELVFIGVGLEGDSLKASLDTCLS